MTINKLGQIPIVDEGGAPKQWFAWLWQKVVDAIAALETSLATFQPLGTTDSPQFTAVNIGHATDTTVSRPSAGNIAVEGNLVYRAGGTDVPVADGGTGASTAAAAATNLGLGTGDSPQFTAINLGHASDTTLTRTGAGDIAIEGNAVHRVGWDADLDAIASSGLAAAGAAYTPTVAAGTGTFTTVAATGRWWRAGKWVFVRIKVTITTNGTAATYFTVTAPAASANVDAAFFQSLSTIRTAGGDDKGRGALQNNSTTIFVQKYDGTYLGGSGAVINITGWYEAA